MPIVQESVRETKINLVTCLRYYTKKFCSHVNLIQN